MMSGFAIGTILAAFTAALIWIVFRSRDRSTRGGANIGEDAEVDRDVLSEAEQEVRELGSFVTPEDAIEELPDWGPGTPKT